MIVRFLIIGSPKNFHDGVLREVTIIPHNTFLHLNILALYEICNNTDKLLHMKEFMQKASNVIMVLRYEESRIKDAAW